MVSTENWGIKIDGKSPPKFEMFTDSAFADNPDRKSTEGYVFKAFGSAIDWKSSKQSTVTTSTTEAELLSLAHGGQQLLWWRRLLKELRIENADQIKNVLRQ